MIDLYSAEAEHAVLGAMIQQPHLIDVLSDDLSSGAFYYAENRDLYRLILSVRNAGGVVDILTLGQADARWRSADHCLRRPVADEHAQRGQCQGIRPNCS